jgi:hypothetical protein
MEANMAEQKVFSACPHDCPDTCAMITTVRDGKAIDVRIFAFLTRFHFERRPKVLTAVEMPEYCPYTSRSPR